MAKRQAEELAGRGVRAVALTWVDNAGVTRTKTVPTNRLPYAATYGVGMSPVFDVFCVDDSITASRYTGGPVGDLRLYPDLAALAALPAAGWAWAPVDRYTQDDEPYPGDQRTFARRMVARAADAGLEFRMAFEVEWFVGADTPDGSAVPACTGPAYGMTRVLELPGYLTDVLDGLAAAGVSVDQLHPEYAAGQFEVSVAADDPVTAADRLVLVRHVIRAVSQVHRVRVSFAPVVQNGAVGNGGHLHLSAWAGGRNLFAGGTGRHGLTDQGESILAGLLDRLPALVCVGAPSVPSYLRMVPQHWAGVYRCWGRENREAALRLVTGTVGHRASASNAELKCFDGSANPYLLVGAVIAVAVRAAAGKLRLPAEVTVDPSGLPDREAPERLPQALPAAIDRLAADEVLREAMGAELFEAFLAVRRAEVELFADQPPDDVVAATRWVY